MSKLFKLREWLTLEEAAAHISNVLGEDASIADLYRFALDGHLKLSVDFVNYAYARKGRWVKTEDVQFVYKDFKDIVGDESLKSVKLPVNNELRVSGEDWIALDKEVISIGGVWDLPMIGAESLDIEHEYQQLTSGVEVKLVAIDGAFVQRGDIICQLQEDFDSNEYQKGSKARKKNLERYIVTNDVSKEKAETLRAEFKIERDEYKVARKNKAFEENFYPAGALGVHEYVLVIRTEELTRFIQSLEDTPKPEKELSSKERNSLLVLIGAFCKEVNIDPNKRGVAASLVKMTEILGAPLTDDTIRKILKQIDEAVSLRKK